jgi:hypothetical protein
MAERSRVQHSYGTLVISMSGVTWWQGVGLHFDGRIADDFQLTMGTRDWKMAEIRMCR